MSIGRLLGAWHADATTIALLVGAAYLYLSGVARVRGWPPARTLAFLAGLGALALALLSGLDVYDGSLLSVHMAQHMLLMLGAPLLLAAGAPIRLALGSTRGRARRRLARVLSRAGFLARPAIAWTLYAAVLLGTHLTGVYDLTLRDGTLHDAEHAAYLATGFLFFAPLIGADPLPHRAGAVGRFVWLTAWMVPMSALGALLNFSQSVRYSAYVAPAQAPHVSALADQHLAGAIMWAGSALVIAPLTLWLVFDALLTEERRQQRRELHAAVGR